MNAWAREYGNLVHGRAVATPPASDVAAIEHISVCKAMNRVMVVMKDGRAHTFKAARWEYLAGLVELAKSFGAPEVRRLQNGLEVYVNKAA